MKKMIALLLLAGSTGLGAQILSGEDSAVYLKEGSRGLKFGGWINPVYLNANIATADGQSELSGMVTTVKLWAGYSFRNADIYVRGRDTYTSLFSSSNYGGDTSDNVLDLDVGFVRLFTASRSVMLSAGRKFFALGNGIVLNGRGDGGELALSTRFVDFNAFGMYTGLLIKDANPYGLNEADFNDGAKKIFAGAQLSKAVYNQGAFLYALVERDNGGDDAVTYDAEYYAAGFSGLLSDKFVYRLEGILQKGTSPLADGSGTAEIDAKALFAQTVFYIKTVARPSLNLTYFYGSGDGDRVGASQANGNTAGSDTGFIGFGSLNTGLAFNDAELGNLHFFSAGLGIKPFEALGGRMASIYLAANYNYYRADKVNTAFSVGSDSKDLGQGFEVLMKFLPWSDCSFFAVYSQFMPGDALGADAENRHLGSAGLTLTF